MPKLWFAKDGRRPDTQRGPSVAMSFTEAREAFRGIEVAFVSTDAPEFNADKTSQVPIRAVVEVEPSEGSDTIYARPGFYLLEGLSSEQADQRLKAHRSK